jgi:putative MATE family efflux protein
MNLAVDRTLGRRIFVLAAPVVLAMLSQTAINVVDHILVGRLPSEESIPGQAAIGISLILYWAIGGFLSAISVGTQALTARRFGEQSAARAGQVMLNSVMLAAIASAIFSIGCYLAVPYIFPFFHKDPHVIELGVPYLQYRMLGLFSMVTTISYKSWFDGLGKTHVHMVSAMTMNVINFFLNIALIFGKWGFPAWGVTGSAIASMISSYIGLGLIIYWSLMADYRKPYHNYSLKNLSGRQQWEIAKLSLPSGIATMFVMSGFGLFFKIVGILDVSAHQGSLFAAATQNIIMILMVFFTGSMAYGTATATLVGQSMGAKDHVLAERYGWEAVKLGVYFASVLGVLMMIFPDTVLHAFTKDMPVIDVARPILRICGGLLPFVLSAIVLTQALFGAGNTTFVMIVEFVLHFSCLVPLAYLCGVRMHWGVLGVWCGAFAYIVLLCSIMAWKFAEGKWKDIHI